MSFSIYLRRYCLKPCAGESTPKPSAWRFSPSPFMTEYVLGFAFDTRPVRRVLLIQKEKPDWQAGKMNGIGGKIEPGENDVCAMAREFREECGIDTHPLEWRKFLVMDFPGARVHCFSVHRPFVGARSVTTEHVAMVCVDELLVYNDVGFPPCGAFLNQDGAAHLHAEIQPLPNVRWLVAMALANTQGAPPTITFP